jgi:predicted metal-dependent hydrolase
VSKKSGRISELIEQTLPGDFDGHYLGYFACFNRQQFFEAHDVLEALWLADGKQAENYCFYKGLIQLAGAFVHLQKERLKPSISLLNLAETNLAKYPPRNLGIEIQGVLSLINVWRQMIHNGECYRNPLLTEPAPTLPLPQKSSEMIDTQQSD